MWVRLTLQDVGVLRSALCIPGIPLALIQPSTINVESTRSDIAVAVEHACDSSQNLSSSASRVTAAARDLGGSYRYTHLFN